MQLKKKIQNNLARFNWIKCGMLSILILICNYNLQSQTNKKNISFFLDNYVFSESKKKLKLKKLKISFKKI